MRRYAGDSFLGYSSETKPLDVLDGAHYKCVDTFDEFLLVSGQWVKANATGVAGVSGYSGYSGYSGASGFSGYSGKSGFSGISGISGYSGVKADSNTFYITQQGGRLSRVSHEGNGAGVFIQQIFSGTDYYSRHITDVGVPGISTIPPGIWNFSFQCQIGGFGFPTGGSCLFTPVIAITESTVTTSDFAGATGIITGNSFFLNTGANTAIRAESFYFQTGNINISSTNRLVYGVLMQNIFPTGTSQTNSGVFTTIFSTGTYFRSPIYDGLATGSGYGWTSPAAVISGVRDTLSGISVFCNTPELRANTGFSSSLYILKGSGEAYDSYGGIYLFESGELSADDGVNYIKPYTRLTGRYVKWL